MLAFLKERLPRTWRDGLKRRLFAHHDMYLRLCNLKRAGFVPASAIDVGAFEGEWTADFWKWWPTVSVTMIEPLSSKSQHLGRCAQRVAGSSVLPVALAAEGGKVTFETAETNSRVVPDAETSVHATKVSSVTLDQVIGAMTLRPNLLKLDVQGYELEVMKGGANTLPLFEVIILEVSVLRIGDVPIFREVDRFLEEMGLRLYDLIPQYYRPLDGALWQVDAFYVREGSKLIASRAWNS